MSKSKNLSDKKRLSKVESTRKTFKIFAVSFHGSNLEVMEKELLKQMEVRSSKKIYIVMVNGTDTDTDDGDQTISEATKLEKQTHQIEEVIERCKKDFDSQWESLTSTLSEDLRRYWNEEDVGGYSENAKGDKSFDIHETEDILPKKIHKTDLKVLSSEVNFLKLHNDIDFLRKSPNTKNVGIFIESLNPIPTETSSEYLLLEKEVKEEQQKYSQQIYDQFTCYLYDIEMLTQQFIVYQNDFVEINDTQLPSQEKELWSKFVDTKKDSQTIQDNDAAVGVFLDNLFDTIENHTNLERKNSSVCHLSPFLENNYGKIIVEEANQLLRSAVTNQLNLITYWKMVNMLVNTKITSDSGNKMETAAIELPEFYELLSWESFVQRLETCKKLFDECFQTDLAKGYKLIVLRRNFNKITEVKEKFQLPTRLCFRDFCGCIAPDLANFLRNFMKNSSNKDLKSQPKYTGLVFDDTLKELTVYKKVFRFENGSISSSFQNWFDEDDQMISVKIKLLDTFVYLHRLNSISSNSSEIRIITKNNLCPNIEIFKDLSHPNLSLQWPNGCQIRYNNQYTFVEQSNQYSKDNLEFKRLYTLEAFVIRYLKDDRIQVLTPNGIIYMLGKTSNTDFDFENFSTEDDQKESNEIDFVRNLQNYEIFCKSFEVTLCDGRKLKISMNGNIQEEVTHLLVYEWMDYCEGKKYLARDDGVKMVWNSDCLRCYYPCGTIITTTVMEDCIRTNFECETNIMENIFENTNPTFVAKGANKAKTQNSYVTYNLNYLMQHKNYATVEVCGKDKMEIYSPNGFKLILKENDDDDDNHDPVVVVLIDIGKELSFRIAGGVCTVLSGVSNLEKNK
ncbi:uncharacterized protein LOC129919298 [Episyrphus balteatus]|uniref:uncharacterized protein LOC129919298 n=1 Tax=Episyrphus balteatus TaxID=286459 RepID=UPI002486062E|nr:uncharacterized protein LOC129919298 [Episyrphus balteatus]